MIKKILFLSFITVHIGLFAQVGIGTKTPEPSATLDISSTNSGILIPRMTQAQRNAIGGGTPATSLLIYQTNVTPGFYYYTGATWQLLGGGTGWGLTGDSGTNPATNFIGTTDAQGFSIRANMTPAIRVNSSQNIGVGTTNPQEKLHIVGTAPVFRYQDGKEAVGMALTSDDNGNIFWGSTDNLSKGDQDWLFGTSEPHTLAGGIYHEGAGVVIGKVGSSTHELDVDNGLTTGSTFGIGDVEYLQDGNNETQFSHPLTPDSASGANLGTTINRWNTLYTVSGVVSTSDGRKKEKIESLKYGITELMQLKPISFYWKEDKVGHLKLDQKDRPLRIGLIAEEVQKIIPQAISDYSWKPKSEVDSDTFIKVNDAEKSINYEDLIPVLVHAKQEQHERLLKLQQENKVLLKELKKRIQTKNK